MSSRLPGRDTSAAEITHISSSGVWILAGDKEWFMSYADFPWFKDAPVAKILNVEEPVAGHFHWPDLDIDLSVDILEHPERYPLKAR
jgi:hypothetical protein